MKVHELYPVFLMIVTSAISCQTSDRTKNESMANYEQGTFGYDLAFLMERDSVVVLSNDAGNGQLIVSPKYQAKVFTSTAEGLGGKSFGWVNYKAFDQGIDPHMNAYGGEDRLWLGPEGGPFSLYFSPGVSMDFDNWHTPKAFDTEPWELAAATHKKASLHKDMVLLNYAGTTLNLRVDRAIAVLENPAIESGLGIALPDGVNAVGFATHNTLTNTGNAAWTTETGGPCLWNLDMFGPTPQTVIIIPYKAEGEGAVATTDYFGEISADRIRYRDGLLLFKADGTSRGKLGISPSRALPIAGSYDLVNDVLTITQFDVDSTAVYLNQEWTTGKDPFVGDAVNAYNDGPLADGSQMGPFYELESVSPAAFLAPGGSLSHKHNVYHFTGDRTALHGLLSSVFGITVEELTGAFDQTK